MKFKNLFLFAAIAIVASCGKYEFDATQVNKEVANQQAKNQLGVDIDPNQDWIPVRNGSVTIIANADLENIARVEVLTETPFENEDAMVLNSVECKAGQQATLEYEAPNYLTQLVAACVNDQGEYYIKVFDIDTKVVDFQATSNRARTRADVNVGDFPATIVLGSGTKSFNAQRTEASQDSPIGILIKDNNNRNRWYTAWKDGSWANDMLWQPKQVEGNGGWVLDRNTTKSTICRDVTDEIDTTTIKTDINKYLQKYGNGINGKANNWYNTLLNNTNFTYNNNELESDGNPLLLVPVQMNSTEGSNNSIYYYYYNPAKAPTDKIELANYIKSLPKFKAVYGFYDAAFKREKEFLLPYYGDDTPVENTWGSPVIPKGYKIGFMNRKNKSNNMYNKDCGCTYGVGELNVEVNHLIGHYFNVISNTIAQDVISNENGDTEKIYGPSANGMNWDSPRIIIHSINHRNYLCFEDGSDLNFCDMVVEIKTGTKVQLSAVAPNVEPTVYTLCFEDRPAQADYDMNDVVLMATPKENNTKIELRLVACGAKDKVYLKIEGSSKFNDKEIHELFRLQEDEYFVNTQIGGKTIKESKCPNQTIKLNNQKIIDFLSSIKIYNATTGQTIGMPKQGEAPYGIIVPMRFNYPKEGSDIRKSYPEFINWVRDVTASQDWYRSLEGVDRFPTLINK